MLFLSKEYFRFYIGDESRVVIENSEIKDSSIFRDTYEQALKVMDKTLPLIESDKSLKNVQDENKNSNNIFAFVGDRGTGKTSCMSSIAEMLRDNISDSKYKYEFEKKFPNFKNKHFEVLESTDPSFFSDKKNILEIFIGRLFTRFKEYVERKAKFKDTEKNQVFLLFERVKNSLVSIEKNCVSEDDCVEELMSLSASVELQNNIQNLINRYLNFVEKDFLVIPVDDLDLHTTYAFDMAEQIRKYLTQKNTIILMALKIEQLEYVIEKHYLNLYSLMMEKGFISNNKISEMASDYMTKFIPVDRRFSLKTVDEILNSHVEIVDEKNQYLNNENAYIYSSQHSLKKNIIDHIYHISGFDFSFYLDKDFPLIPSTLRLLRQFIDFLYKISKDTNDTWNDLDYKKDIFEKFAFYSCIREKCGDKFYGRLKECIQYSSFERLNKFIVSLLNDSLNEYFTNDSTNNDFFAYSVKGEINRILRKDNVYKNISVGDVLTLVHFVESVTVDSKVRSYLFGIRFFYTILLNNTSTSVRKNVLTGGLINFWDATSQLNSFGNSFFPLIIPPKIIRDFYENYKQTKIETTLWLFEFFILLMDRHCLYANDLFFRSNPSYSIEADFRKNETDVYINPYRFIFNLIDIDKCYNRLNPDLLDDIKKEKSSIYNQIKEQHFEIESIEIVDEFLSCTKDADFRFNNLQNYNFRFNNLQSYNTNNPFWFLDDIKKIKKIEQERQKNYIEFRYNYTKKFFEKLSEHFEKHPDRLKKETISKCANIVIDKIFKDDKLKEEVVNALSATPKWNIDLFIDIVAAYQNLCKPRPQQEFEYEEQKLKYEDLLPPIVSASLSQDRFYNVDQYVSQKYNNYRFGKINIDDYKYAVKDILSRIRWAFGLF